MSAASQAAEINSATIAARSIAQKRLDEQAAKLRDLIAALANDIADQVRRYAGPDGTVNAAQIPSIRAYLGGRLQAFLQRYGTLIDESLNVAAVVGADILPLTGAIVPQSSLVTDVLQFVRDFRGADGLNLSARIWRVSRQTSDAISQAIQNGILRGQTAAQAAREYIAQGLPVPAELASGIAAGSASTLGRVALDLLTNPDAAGDPGYNLERVLRTEMNRAYTQSYASSASQHPDFAGVKFNLSPAHPKTDICDMYARANLYGLGAGVYPKDQSPWPAHPNTLSFLTTVFADQVSQADIDGAQTWADWLGDQAPDVQDAVLAGAKKGEAFRAGQLELGDLRKPWRDIAPRLGIGT